MSGYIFDARNAAVGDWGELHIKERYESLKSLKKKTNDEPIDGDNDFPF